jgi:trans-2,3-dihydro-3-hydroxyanthranilate isomerase
MGDNRAVATLRYHLLDVFTTEPYRGNPLAVLVGPPELTTEQMQRIAGEFNLSETVFTWPPQEPGGAWRTRIFTPSSELPFAGHPTIGTACLLAELGMVTVRVVLDEPIGAVDVAVPAGEDAWLTVPKASEPVAAAAPEALAASLGLAETDLHPCLRPGAWSAGVPFSIVPVVDLETLARAGVDSAQWEQHLAASAAASLYVVAPVDDGPVPRRWRARMFAPTLGIGEDPATGAAVAAFSGYLLDLIDGDVDGVWQITQGVEMGRASEIGLRIARQGTVTRVEVGGRAVVIGEGTIRAPAP